MCALSYQFAQPSARLKPWIHTYWSWESGESHSTIDGVRIFPSVHNELLITYRSPLAFLWEDGRLLIPPHWHVVANHLSRFELQQTGPVGVFGIRLQPGALSQLFHLNPTEWKQPTYHAADLGNSHWMKTAEQIQTAPNFQTRVAHSEHFFYQLLKADKLPPAHLHWAQQKIHQGAYLQPIRQLWQNLGCPQKTFERQFQALYGFTPKTYARIVRFQHLLRQRPHTNLSQLAYEYGFSDQAHLTHELRQWIGYTPRQWFDHPKPYMTFFYKTSLY